MTAFLQSIRLEGFRSFVQPVELRLPTESGLYLMSGWNKDFPALQGNAVGKSTVWDAVVWCLYGSTTRGVRAGHVRSWAGTTKTVVDVAVNNHLVRRTQAPNELLLDGDPATQEQINDAVGLDQMEFCASVFFGQFSPVFFDLSPADKLQRLTELLRLDFWQKCSASAKAQEQSGLATKTREQARLSGLQGQETELVRAIEQLDAKSVAWDSTRTTRIREVRGKLQTIKDDLELTEEAYREAVAKDRSSRETEDPVPNLSLTLEARIAEMREEIGRCQADEAAANRQIKDIDRQGPTCSVCLQPIGPEYKNDQICRLEDDATKARQTIEEVNKKSQETGSELMAIRTAARLRAEREANQTSVLSHLNQEIKSHLDLASEVVSQLERLRGEENVFEYQVIQERGRLEELNDDIAKVVKKIAELERSVEAAKFWVTGFRDLRLWLIDQSLLELEIGVNNSLLQLGLDGWKIEFAVERETKSKKIARGFAVMISSPGSTKMVPWNCWSGGELQRLRLAGAIGFAGLVLSRRNVAAVDVEVWDEPTAHLSDSGIRDLLQLLETRAVAEGKTIWVIDHHSLEYGGFRGIHQVVREDGTSSIREALA